MTITEAENLLLSNGYKKSRDGIFYRTKAELRKERRLTAKATSMAKMMRREINASFDRMLFEVLRGS